MSIVNISSENVVHDGINNDADYKISLKKPLMRAIGIQILNVTVPLTYNIINPENNTFVLDVATDEAFTLNTDKYTVKIAPGTYDPDDFTWALTRSFNNQTGKKSNGTDIITNSDNRIANRNQWKYHKESGLHELPVTDKTLPDCNVLGVRNSITMEEVEPGMILSNNERILTTSITTNPKELTVTTTGASLTFTGGDTITIKNFSVIAGYDRIKNAIYLAHATLFSRIVEGDNPTRILKTIGLQNGDHSASPKTGLLTGGSETPENAYLTLGTIYINKIILGSHGPELTGPSIMYLRLGGDVLLDQQNTETHNNDRIPIPIDQPHGGIVHFESDDKTDVIPLSIPCDITRLHIRFEYGDDNEILGGETHNLRGHHTYVRLKVYFAHQN